MRRDFLNMGEYFAGCVSGMVGVAVGHPIDTIKVQQQNEGIGMAKCIKNIVTTDGYKGYFRGLSFPLLASGALNSIFFGVYGSTLNRIVELKEYQQHSHSKFSSSSIKCEKQNKANFLEIYLAGCVAGVAQLGLACPVDLIKVKLQAHGFRMGSSSECLKMILRERGIGGLYQGIGIMAIRDIPAFGLYIAMYEFQMEQLKELTDGLQIDLGGGASAHLSNSALAFLAGGLSGCVSWWSIIPQDVVKSRMQADDPNAPKYKGTIHCVEVIMKEHGFRGFFRGFWPLSIRAYLVNGAIFVSYEWLQFLYTFVIRDQDLN
ncbi:unnamed protein product [Allacma fusca]|uniref:Mitochondrial carrier protein n=1 Tax=Allacma fusca TaxID=39272 RepID=A0A8J2L066_9HEXA|nr:unnamed protein product [Allacma fusca]